MKQAKYFSQSNHVPTHTPKLLQTAQRANNAPATIIKPGTTFAFAPPVTCTNGTELVVDATVPFAVAVTWVTAAVLVLLLFTSVEGLAVEVVGFVVRDELGVEVVDTETEAGVVEGEEERVEVGVSETREPVRLYAAAQAARSIPCVR